MHSRILEGIARGEFHVLYQPQMTPDGTRVASVEALVRWTAPGGPVPPLDFLGVAEMTGAISDIGAFVLRQACLDARNWSDIRVAVNISAMQLRERSFAGTAAAIVRETGLPFDRLELELVESAFVDDFAQAERVIQILRGLGVTIALDDFGTGYSSLTYLMKLPLDKLKIDRSFVAGLCTVQSAAIIHAIVALARALGLKVTAEGVETPEQHRFLRACGCHYLQGFLFSQPVPAARISEMLALRKAG